MIHITHFTEKVKTLFSKVDTVKIMPLWKSLLFDWGGNVFIITPLCERMALPLADCSFLVSFHSSRIKLCGPRVVNSDLNSNTHTSDTFPWGTGSKTAIPAAVYESFSKPRDSESTGCVSFATCHRKEEIKETERCSRVFSASGVTP